MGVVRKRNSLERRSYYATRSFLRRLGLKGAQPSGVQKLKIFTNVQTATVAGISRVMASFGDYVRSAAPEEVEMVCMSLAATPTGEPEWQELPAEEGASRTYLYNVPLPDFGETIQTSSSLEEVERRYEPLIAALKRQLVKERPDVVLANGTYLVPWCLVRAAQSLRLPVILYYHGSLTKETEHWKEKGTREMLHAMEASFDRKGVKFVFPSTLIRDFIEKDVFRRRLYRRNALVLPNPIPEEFFSTPSSKSRRRIAYVGRWTRIKNTSFLERFVELNHRMGSPFDIYVLTDDASRARAVKVLHDRVRFVRPKSQSEGLASFYAGMSAIICPSHFETYGNVAQEAVAAGTPAYVSRNMGVSEVFERVGLSHFILSFANPRKVFETLREDAHIEVPEKARMALRAEAAAPVVHKKLLAYLNA